MKRSYIKENPPQFLQSNPTFQTDGKFDSQKYLSALASPQGDEWVPIENWMRASYIPNLKLTQFLNEDVLVTEQDVKMIYKRMSNLQLMLFMLLMIKPKIKQSHLKLNLQMNIKLLDDFKHDELRNVSFVSWKNPHLLKIA